MTDAPWTDRSVREALGLPTGSADETLRFSGISTDSRAVREGELFVALVGERFDAHDYLDEAFARGAAGAVVSRAPGSRPDRTPDHTPDLAPDLAPDRAPGGATGAITPERPLYEVPDTLKALGALASWRRNALSLRVVGITGSSGKTTTKELVRAALEGRYTVHATAGNLNNRIGLPLTILRAPADAEVLILEMGTSEPGEIATLTRIAMPDVGVITTIGDAHLEGLGSREGILREKLALATEMPRSGSLVVGDEPVELAERARAIDHAVRVAGWTRRADPGLRPSNAAPDPLGRFAFDWEGQRIQLGIPGRHGVSAALLALAVARILDVPASEAARGIAGVTPVGMRGEVRTIGKLTLILDCYNANPQSMEAALDLLALVSVGGARVAILGSMLELGEGSDEIHRTTLRSALARPLDLVVATGEFDRTHRNGVARPTGPGASTTGAGAPKTSNAPAAPALIHAPDLAAAYNQLRGRLRGDEVILLKGSRGAAVEALLPLFERDFGGGS